MNIAYLATLSGREMGIGAIVQPKLVTDLYKKVLSRATVTKGSNLCKKVVSGATVSKGFLKTVQDTGVKTLASATVVDVALLAVSTGYYYYQYKKGYISWERYKWHMTKRVVATGGSIAGTTIGACIGTAICPGVGTFLGGVIGGIAGDWIGSKFGETVYNWFWG